MCRLTPRWEVRERMSSADAHVHERMVPAVGQIMQFGDNYLNDGHLLPEIPQIDGRDSFISVSYLSLAVSFEMPDDHLRRGRPLRLAVAKA